MATLYERRTSVVGPLTGHGVSTGERVDGVDEGQGQPSIGANEEETTSPGLKLSSMPSPLLLPSSEHSSPASRPSPAGVTIPHLMMTRNASSSSSFSRQSSVRSTTSVQAVPMRTPARTPIHSPALSRTGSSYGYSPFVPDLAGLPDIAGSPNLRPTPLPESSLLPIHIEPHPASSLSHERSDSTTVHGHSYKDSASTVSPPATPGLKPPHLAMLMAPDLSRTTSAQSIASTSGSGQRKSRTDFDNFELLGQGSYSRVFSVTDKTPPHRKYALKVLEKRHIIRERKEKYVQIEKNTLNRLGRHPGIVRIYWTFHDEGHLYFVLELAEQGEILTWLRKFGSFEVDCAKFYCAQVLSAVEHMHAKGIIHRDLKPENILLDANLRVKITDFGTAKLLDMSSTVALEEQRGGSFVGTAEYVSPEVLQSKEAYQSSDLWAFGVILYQLISGHHPFKGPTEYLTFMRITKLDYSFPSGFPEDAADLVRSLLVIDHRARLSIDEIKRHPFFASIDWSTIWTITPPSMRTGMSPPPPPPQPIDPRFQGLDYIYDDDGSPAPPPPLDHIDNLAAPLLLPSMPAALPPGAGNGSLSSRSSGQSSSGRHSPVAVNNRAVSPRPRSRLAGAFSLVTKSSSHPPPPPATHQPEQNGWSAALKDDEMVVYSSPVLERSRGVLFPNKKRTLVLTDGNRLLSIKEPAQRERRSSHGSHGGVKVKSAVLLGRDDGESEAMVQVVDEEGSRVFKVVTSMKTYRYEDPNGDPGRWVRELRLAHDAGRSAASSNNAISVGR